MQSTQSAPARDINESKDSQPRLSPPYPPSRVFRVGVVGHRPDRLQNADLDELAKAIHTALKVIKTEVETVFTANADLYADGAPIILRAISPLAEGTDRIFAKEALALDYNLSCVTPFPKAEFENDFEEGQALEAHSKKSFRLLWERAGLKVELDGLRSNSGAAYGAGGRIVMNHSDLLIVVWDGQRKGKRGGTEETFDEARARGLPILWIDANRDHGWKLIEANTPLPLMPTGHPACPGNTRDIGGIRQCIRNVLDVPSPNEVEKKFIKREKKNESLHLTTFYRDRSADCTFWKWGLCWKLFQGIFGFHKKTSEGIKSHQNQPASPRLAPLLGYLFDYEKLPKKLAGYYSNRYRSAYVLAFGLSAFAVAMALLPIPLEDYHFERGSRICNAAELISIFFILWLVIWGGIFKQWHTRWLHCRLTAELFRYFKLVSLLDGAPPFPQAQAHASSYGQPGATWMAWYARAVERAMPIPSMALDNDYLKGFLIHLDKIVDSQIEFHEKTCERDERIETRLHLIEIIFFTMTLFCCIAHFGSEWQVPGCGCFENHHKWLTFGCGFFPAVGAALAGIKNQGEFSRTAKRSKAMKTHLTEMKKEIATLRAQIETTISKKQSGEKDKYETQFSVKVSALTNRVATLMINEVMDWRVVFLDRPLTPPA